MAACDAQTSGGLLISVRESDASDLLRELKESNHPEAAVIGVVEAKQNVSLVIRK